jgi:hypothetical protein
MHGSWLTGPLRVPPPPGSIPMSMATATRSSRANPTDARIPCPVCGQHIHPVAGRCKHCKTDLVKLREQRGVRAPRLDPATLAAAASYTPGASPFAPPPTVAPMQPLPLAPGPGGPVAGGPLPVEPALAGLPDAAPTLVDLPAAYGDAAAIAPQSTWSRRWPVLVVALAGAAILLCAYLLLFANGDGGATTPTTLPRPAGAMPAPDRMDTSPARPVPVPTPRGQAPSTPTDPWGSPDDPPPPDLDDPLARGGSGPRSAPTAEQFPLALMDTVCDRLNSCNLDDLLGGVDVCPLLRLDGEARAADVRAGKCTYDPDRARKCLDAVSRIQCDGSISDIDGMARMLADGPECLQALVCQ